MNKADYDRALHYTYHSQWDNLLILMVRTKDDLLSKKIERFLHAYYFLTDYNQVEEKLYSLLQYVDYANSRVCQEQEKLLQSI